MKNGVRTFLLALGAVAAGALYAGCSSAGGSANAPSAVSPVAYGSLQTIRVVDGTGSPVAGVMVVVHPETGSAIRAGISNGQGELMVPVLERAVYLFSRGGRTLLGQTAENLFSVGPSVVRLYRSDGGVLLVPVNFAPTSSPLVSPVNQPVIDPVAPAPTSAAATGRVGR
jgi:hypothetical protein